jgi:hypothetical protein
MQPMAPFWWLGDARQLLTFHIDALVPVFAAYLRSCVSDDMPLHTSVDRAAFNRAFIAGGFPPDAIDALFTRFKNRLGYVDMLQVCPHILSALPPTVYCACTPAT